MHHDKHYAQNYGMRHHSGRSVIPFVVGIVATMLVGGYVLFGPEGRRNRRSLDRFLKRAKFEILDKMEQAGEVTEDQYYKIVDEVSARYGSLKEKGSDTANSVASYFRERWDEMSEAAKRAKEEARAELEEEERSIRSGKSGGSSSQTYPLSEQSKNPPSQGGGNTPEGTN